MIPQSFIHDLLARVEIVDVIESHVPLKRAGSNYVARCPFHNEKTPSFTVSQTKQFYHCFGCGAHGTAISFLMEFHGMGFVDAVKELAARVGMALPDTGPSGERRGDAGGEKLVEVLAVAAQFYRSQLKASARAVDYLKGRGLSGEIAARFGLGYAPDGWQGLEAVFGDYRDNRALATAGLVVDTAERRRYDRFRDRIMFPIQNARGVIIGFGGRVIGSGEPKYLNSPETPVFEKGHELYGLYQARQAIREAGLVLVVEGYMDVVALAQNGIGYAVATLGTATTPQQVQKLLRQAERVVYCFDGDAAGRRAAWRALENSLGHVVDGKRIDFLFLPESEDPDSFVRGRGRPEFEALLARAQPLSEFLVEELSARTDLRTAEGRAKLLQDAKPLVKAILAPVLSLLLRKRLAELAGVTQAELDERFEIKGSVRPRAADRRAAPKPSILRQLAEMIVFRPALAASIDPRQLTEFADLAGVEVPAAEYQILAELLNLTRQPSQGQSLTESFRGGPLEGIAQQVETNSLIWEERRLDESALRADFLGAWHRLIERFRKARILALLEKSKRDGWTEEDKARYLELQRPICSGIGERTEAG